MTNEFIYKYIKISRSGSYMKSPGALYKKLNLLGEIYFDMITFCQDERTCVMYFSESLYPYYGVFGSSITHDSLPAWFKVLLTVLYILKLSSAIVPIANWKSYPLS